MAPQQRVGKGWWNLTAGLLLAFTAAHARADDASDTASLDDLDLVRLLNVEVSTASKTLEKVDDAPADITVVTREEIQRWGYQTVAEVLQQALGFYALDDHILPNVAVRGMTGGLGAESSVIKVMIDGRSVAFRSTSGNWLGTELIPLESIQQIEIIRGPASALYGADAFLGVVNIITQPPDETRPVRARVTVGMNGGNPGGRFDVVGGHDFGRLDFMLGAAGEHADRTGLVLPPQSPAPVLPSRVGERRKSLNLERRSLVLQSRLGYRVADVGHVVLSAYASGLERGGDFAQWAQLTNTADGENSALGTTIALGQYRINVDGLLHLTSQLDLAVQSTYFQGGVLPADQIDVASELFYVERNTGYRGADSMAELRYTPLAALNLLMGVENVFDRERLPVPRRVASGNGESLAADTASPGSVSLINVGTYLGANYRVSERWLKLNGGLRYDHHSKYGDQITGRAGATSNLTKRLVAKLLYGSAFKAPSPYLLYAVPFRPGDVIGNSQLKPQYIHTTEALATYRPLGWLSLSSSVSYNWLRDKAEFTPQGINQTARNVAKQHSISWESRLAARYRDEVDAYLAFELVASTRDTGREGYAAELVGTRNVVYPPWIGRAGLSVRIPSLRELPLELAAQGMLVGPRRAADASILEAGHSFELPSYFMLNLSLATRELYLIRGHESRIAIRARNLLATTGPDPGFSGFEYALAPREVFLELRHLY